MMMEEEEEEVVVVEALIPLLVPLCYSPLTTTTLVPALRYYSSPTSTYPRLLLH